ncbi:MAG: helix-turn-helix transcriptional regulator [Christensenellaceae bacterium]|jgi:PadR family transcriptional regulator PadR|nr:helix-turn-helix transcriptional regulator [Christensenellaceae bacterium]
MDSPSIELVRGHADTIIMNILMEQDRYGYEIIEIINERSHSRYSIKQPTLYNALKRLEKLGFVESYYGEESNGGRRRYYTLTDKGHKTLMSDQKEWEFSRAILDTLLSDKKVDLETVEAPYDPNEFRPATKRVRTHNPNLKEQSDSNTAFDFQNNFYDLDEAKQSSAHFVSGHPINNSNAEAIKTEISTVVSDTPNISNIFTAVEPKPIMEPVLSLDATQTTQPIIPLDASEKIDQTVPLEATVLLNQTSVDEPIRKLEREVITSESGRTSEVIGSSFPSSSQAELVNTPTSDNVVELKNESKFDNLQVIDNSKDSSKPDLLLDQTNLINNSIVKEIDIKNEQSKIDEDNAARLFKHNLASDNLYATKSDASFDLYQTSSDIQTLSRIKDVSNSPLFKATNKETTHISTYQDKILQEKKSEAARALGIGSTEYALAAYTKKYDLEQKAKNEAIKNNPLLKLDKDIEVKEENEIEVVELSEDDIKAREKLRTIFNPSTTPTPMVKNMTELKQTNYVFNEARVKNFNQIRDELTAQGYKFRVYSKPDAVNYYNLNYVFSNRILRDTAIFVYLFAIVDLFSIYLAKDYFEYSMTTLIIIGASFIILPILALFVWIKHPTKRIKARFNFISSLIYSFISLVLVLAVITITTLLSGGFVSGKVFVPYVLSTNIPLFVLIYALLYYSKSYHVKE